MSTFAALRNPGRLRIAGEPVVAFARVLRGEFGVPFRFYDGSTGARLGDPDPDECDFSMMADSAAEDFANDGRLRVSAVEGGCYQIVMPITQGGAPTLVAIGYLTAFARSPLDSWQETERLLKWVEAVAPRLSSAGRTPDPHASATPNTKPSSITLEAILELNDLLRGLGGADTAVDGQNRILERVAVVLPVGALIWVPAQAGEPIVRGNCDMSARDCRQLIGELTASVDRDVTGCIILNRVTSSDLGRMYPGIENLMALPDEESAAAGWLIAVNKIEAASTDSRRDGGPAGQPAGFDSAPHHPGPMRPAISPFRRIDAAHLMPFAALLGVQSRGDRRNAQVRAMFVGLTRSLIAAIDAKDSYTSGHSERVARIAVELGRELDLDERELSDLYLGGLLHDIGKIGVQDSILRKEEPLTPDETEEVRKHVTVGAGILADFHAVSHLLPMVLHHHEHYDGAGYPAGLRGEAIPLLARILAVADSCDAMSTSRPYRTALPHTRVDKLLAHGADIQWDGRVIEAYFRARDRIHAIHQCGVGDSVCFAIENAFR